MTLQQLYERRLASEPARTLTVTTGAIIFDAVACVGLLVAGLYTLNFWCLASAAYYLAVGATRRYLHRRLATAAWTADLIFESRVYRRAGMLLGVSGTAYLATNLCLYFTERSSDYPWLAAYSIAVAAFAKCAFAINGFVRAKRSGSPIQVALRITNLCDTLVSLAVTQYALLTLTQFPDAGPASATLGMGFSAIIAVVGVTMAIRKPRQG
ncbi:MAG: hypothetical protein LBI99_00385 [Propionibacteriaceae bacterium]|jgi:hypothetical protein|nr:hypothetical protein [Propionibacteriaceae bacterium]